MTAQFGNLALRVTKIKAHEHRACADPWIQTLGTAFHEAEHRSIEGDVPRIHLDEKIRAAIDAARMDIRDVE